MNSFICQKCRKKILNSAIGTHNRNHCPFCLHSLHIDKSPGDRKELCHGLMKPLGLTFKEEGDDKYGNKKQGELMIVFQCEKCGDIDINRIAGDDDANKIIKIFDQSLQLNLKIKKRLIHQGINLLIESNLLEIKNQLIGINHLLH